MKEIGVIVAVICITALTCSIVSVVAPQGNIKKVLNIVLGVFVLCCMIVPIKSAISNFNTNITIAPPGDDLIASADEAYNEAVFIETKNNLQSTLKAYLTEKSIYIEDVIINLASYDNGGIYIDSICIYIAKEDENNMQKIQSLTNEKFEVIPKIVLR